MGMNSYWNFIPMGIPIGIPIGMPIGIPIGISFLLDPIGIPIGIPNSNWNSNWIQLDFFVRANKIQEDILEILMQYLNFSNIILSVSIIINIVVHIILVTKDEVTMS